MLIMLRENSLAVQPTDSLHREPYSLNALPGLVFSDSGSLEKHKLGLGKRQSLACNIRNQRNKETTGKTGVLQTWREPFSVTSRRNHLRIAHYGFHGSANKRRKTPRDGKQQPRVPTGKNSVTGWVKPVSPLTPLGEAMSKGGNLIKVGFNPFADSP